MSVYGSYDLHSIKNKIGRGKKKQREFYNHVFSKRKLDFPLLILHCFNFYKKKKVVSRDHYKNCFGLFLSAIFLFREILNLNVPIAFVVSMILNLSIIAA